MATTSHRSIVRSMLSSTVSRRPPLAYVCSTSWTTMWLTRGPSFALALALGLTVACGPAEPPASGGEPQASRSESAPAGVEEPGARETDDRPVVLFLGTSLTAGLGVAPEQAFPARIQERIDAQGLALRVVNAGVSGDTSAGGLGRIDWLLRLPVRVLVLELGANDMLRGQPPASIRSNLQAIIDRARARHPDLAVVIAGMQAAPNLGDTYAEAFAEVFASLAHDNGAARVPFLLEGVAGVRDLNQADAMHPNADGHAVIARNVWPVLEPLLPR